MKKIQELKEGKCTVIANNVAENKEFEGYYNSNLNLVFFTIPSTYQIVGYIQD